jgi:hypothetical protein
MRDVSRLIRLEIEGMERWGGGGVHPARDEALWAAWRTECVRRGAQQEWERLWWEALVAGARKGLRGQKYALSQVVDMGERAGEELWVNIAERAAEDLQRWDEGMRGMRGHGAERARADGKIPKRVHVEREALFLYRPNRGKGHARLVLLSPDAPEELTYRHWLAEHRKWSRAVQAISTAALREAFAESDDPREGLSRHAGVVQAPPDVADALTCSEGLVDGKGRVHYIPVEGGHGRVVVRANAYTRKSKSAQVLGAVRRLCLHPTLQREELEGVTRFRGAVEGMVNLLETYYAQGRTRAQKDTAAGEEVGVVLFELSQAQRYIDTVHGAPRTPPALRQLTHLERALRQALKQIYGAAFVGIGGGDHVRDCLSAARLAYGGTCRQEGRQLEERAQRRDLIYALLEGADRLDAG